MHLAFSDIVELAQDLIRIPSVNPPGGEEPVARRLQAFLQLRGVESELQMVSEGRPNLIAEVGSGRSPSIALNGHMDVVGPGKLEAWSVSPFAAAIEGRKLVARGAYDMKGGLAAMAAAVAALHQGGALDGTVLLTAVVGEEEGNEGTRFLIDHGFRADAVIVGEPAGRSKIGIGYRGLVWLELETHGVGSHGSRPHLGMNAITRMTEVVLPAAVRAVSDLPFSRNNEFLLPYPTVNVGQIRGGSKVNVVPDSCTASIDIRLVPGQRVDEVIDALTTAIPGASDGSTTVRVLHRMEPHVADKNSSLVKAVAEAIESVTAAPPEYIGKTGSSDANVIAAALGIPAIAYGPGGGNGHSPNEWVDVDDLPIVAEVYVEAAIRYLASSFKPNLPR
jgi:acetylornithine deacetylase/succinyl-diaminopimelate desuccinylase family protein